jgi:hypothetical protein
MGWARDSRCGEERKDRERYTDELSHGPSHEVVTPGCDDEACTPPICGSVPVRTTSGPGAGGGNRSPQRFQCHAGTRLPVCGFRRGLNWSQRGVEPDGPSPCEQHPAIAAHEVCHRSAIEGIAVQPEATVERVPQSVPAARELAPNHPQTTGR